MKRISIPVVLGILLVVSWLVPGTVLAKGSGPGSLRELNLNTTLEPGVSSSWVIGPSSACSGYVVEATPKRPAMQGAYVEALVRPEFNGDEWNDVLRAQIPAEHPALKANLRVYASCELEVASEIEATLIAGEWMGWIIGPAAMDRGFVVEVNPLEPSVEGAYVEKALVQEEFFMGEWLDVLRVQMPADLPDLRVQFRVYATDGMPVLAEYDVDLEPGVWTGIGLRPSTAHGGYVVEINPRSSEPAAGEFVERLVVQPEFDGKSWNDVLRLMTPIDQPPMSVQARVYVWGAPPSQK